MIIKIKSMEIVVDGLAMFDAVISHAGSYLKDLRFPDLEKVSFEFNETIYTISKEV